MNLPPSYSIAQSITINCSIASAFEFLSCVESLAVWDSTVTHVRRLSDGPVGVGMRFEQMITYEGGSVRAESVVIAYEPPHRLGWLRELAGRRETTRITLELADGSTLIRVRRQPDSPDFDIGLESNRLNLSLHTLCRLLEIDR